MLMDTRFRHTRKNLARLLCLIVLACPIALVCLPAVMLRAGQTTPLQVEEERLEALFIWQFLQFTEWPNTVPVGEASGTSCIGIIGSTRVGMFLEELARQKKLPDGTTMTVKRIISPEDAEKCRIIYISSTTEPAKAAQLLTRMKNKPVLTIGHDERFMERGGIINLYNEDERLRFEVNLAEANNNKLKLSARLLRLAARIYNR